MKGLALITGVLLLCLHTVARPRCLWLESDIAAAGQQQSIAEPTVEGDDSGERATFCDKGVTHIVTTVSESLKPSLASSLSNIRRDTIVSSSGATVIDNGGSSTNSGGLSQSDTIAIGIGVPTGIATIIGVIFSWRTWKKRKDKKKAQAREQAWEQNGSNGGSQHYSGSFANSQQHSSSYASSAVRSTASTPAVPEMSGAARYYTRSTPAVPELSS